MSVLSRSLIAAAGNAAGGLSYWVDRIQTNSSYTPSLRSVVNTTEEKIIITNGEQLSTRHFVELDYDGGLISSSLYTASGVGTRSTLLAIDSNNYNFFSENTSQLRFVNLDDTSATILNGNHWNTFNTLGASNYDATGFTADFDQETANDWIVFVRGGNKATYFTGYGEYYQATVGVAKYSIQSNTTSEAKYITGAYDSIGAGARYVVVTRGLSQKYAIMWQDPALAKVKFATYTTVSGVNNPLYNLVQYTFAVGMESKGIFIDSNDIMSAVTTNTSQTWIWRASVAGVYEPTKRYVFNHTATLGDCSSSTMDADGNIYIYYDNGYLVKFSNSNTIEWCLSIDNTLVGTSFDEYINEIKVQSIDGDEFLLMSLVFPVESGSNYSWYIIKAPLDFNNYLGTYGNIQVSNYSFSPTVTENNHTRDGAGGGINTGFGNQVTSNASNTSVTVSVTTTDI